MIDWIECNIRLFIVRLLFVYNISLYYYIYFCYTNAHHKSQNVNKVYKIILYIIFKLLVLNKIYRKTIILKIIQNLI